MAVCLLTVLQWSLFAPYSEAKIYRLPEDRRTQTLKKVFEKEIPKELSKADCGYQKDVHENDALTKVAGLPLRPETWRDRPTATNEEIANDPEEEVKNEFPRTASGYAFAVNKGVEACQNKREAEEPPCRDPNGCKTFCDEANETMRYHVYRIASCRKLVENPPEEVPEEPAPEEEAYLPSSSLIASAMQWWSGLLAEIDPEMPVQDMITVPEPDAPDGFHYEEYATDDATQCNACQDGDEIASYQYVGDKYMCTGDGDEQQDLLPDGEGVVLHTNYGWVWRDGKPDVAMPSETCTDEWANTEKEAREHPNCIPCSGTQCRTDEKHRPPPNDDTFEPLSRDTAYESFFRFYTATHELGDIPDTTTNENEPTHLACYQWYRENLDPKKAEDLNCIADDLHIDALKERKVTGSPTFNLEDEATSSLGAFSLNQYDKTGSTLAVTALPEVKPLLPFGETPKYVTTMRELEKVFEEFPPTVQLILPQLQAGKKSSSSSIAASSVVDLTAPLRSGLIENVQDYLRQSLLTPLQEEPIPVVLPLVSETELEAALQSWQSWKEKMESKKNSNVDTSEADDIIAKLQEYQHAILSYRKLRSELPRYLASVLDRRKTFTDAVNQWVNSRMEPYRTALADYEQEGKLLDAWLELKKAYGDVEEQNGLYCKNDRTTPSLKWLELPDDFDLPEMPDIPRHLVFDFSTIVLSSKERNALSIPVFEPVQVALKIPSAPDPDLKKPEIRNTLPSLPPVPELPAPDEKELTIEKQYKEELRPKLVPYEEFTKDFTDKTKQMKQLEQRYRQLLWVKEPHPELACTAFGKDGCVFPETKLWHTFMRVWSPVGTFLRVDEPPEGEAYSSSSSEEGEDHAKPVTPSAPDCDPDDDACWLGEELYKESLRVTPPKDSQQTSLQKLRDQMREKTIDDNGSVVTNDDKPLPFDIGQASDLYEIFQVPDPFPLDATGSVASSASSTETSP